VSSHGKAVAFLVVAFLLSGCVGDRLPSERETPAPATEAATPQEAIATASISPTARTSEETSTPPDPTATFLAAALPVCRNPETTGPDELELLFVATWDGDDELYTVRSDGSNLTQITNNETGDVGPSWSPDGQRLASVANAITNPRW